MSHQYHRVAARVSHTQSSSSLTDTCTDTDTDSTSTTTHPHSPFTPRTTKDDMITYLQTQLALVNPRLSNLHSQNAVLRNSLYNAEAEIERAKEAVAAERSFKAHLSEREVERLTRELRMLEDAVDRVNAEKRNLEDELRMRDGMITIMKRKVEESNHVRRELEDSVAKGRGEIGALSDSLRVETEEVARLKAAVEDFAESKRKDALEKERLSAAVQTQVGKKREALKYLKALHDHCLQELFDTSDLTLNTTALRSFIDKNLANRNPATFGYSTTPTSSRRSMVELIVGILRLEAFKVGCLSDLEVVVDADPGITGVDLVIEFLREDKVVGVVLIGVICVTAESWYERFLRPNSPHNRAPFQTPKKRTTNKPPTGPTYRETIARVKDPDVIHAFRDETKTVCVHQKDGVRYLSVRELMDGRMEALRSVRLNGRHDDEHIVRQRIVVGQIVSACIVDTCFGHDDN